MEHAVTIAIPERNEDVVMAIFDGLVSRFPETGVVMHQQTTSGPTDFVLGVDAADALEASTAAVDLFRSAVEGCSLSEGAELTIVDLHAERVSDEALAGSSELQTA